jgi:coenzyme F420 hydrogenase subunit beta
MKEVINPGFCLGCGACVASCPFSVLEMVKQKPKLVGRCELCEICYFQCPQLISSKELEQKVFGRNVEVEETVGVYKGAVSVKTSDPEVITRCQDGGAVTSLLESLLDAGFIDAAIVTASDEWYPSPQVATSKVELLQCAGTRYSRGAVLLGVRNAADLYAREKVAFVGLPCQIKALRRMQFNDLAVHRVIDGIKLCIGLFCMESFPYEEFFKKVIEEQLGIKLTEVTKFDIKRGRFQIYCRDKPKRELAVKALRQFVDAPCRLCPDFAAELADLSVGAVGSPLGSSTVILRTPLGAEAFRIAEEKGTLKVRPIEEVKPGIKAVERLSASKKRAMANELERRRRLGEPLPSWLQEQQTPPA